MGFKSAADYAAGVGGVGRRPAGVGGSNIGDTVANPPPAAPPADDMASFTRPGVSAASNSASPTSRWYDNLSSYGHTSNWGGYANTANTSDNTNYSHDMHAGDIDGGLNYTDAAQNTAVDKNGTVYVKFTTTSGDQVWQPYQQGNAYHDSFNQTQGFGGTTDSIGGSGQHQALSSGSGSQVTAASNLVDTINASHNGTPAPLANPAANATPAGVVGGDGSSGVGGTPAPSAATQGSPTVTQAGPGGGSLQAGTNVTDTAATVANAPQTTANSSATTSSVGGAVVPGAAGVGGNPVVSAAVPTTQAESAVVNPINHDFIAGLQSNIASGNNAVTANAQAQETQNSNMERMAAGANTLNGNYAAQGAAGQGQEALLGQQQTQQANVAGAAQQHQDEGRLGQALGQESQQAIGADKAAMDSQASQLQDLTQTLQNEIQGKTDQQSQQIKQYIDSITTALSQYQNGAAQSNFDQQKLMEYLKTAFSAAATVAALA